MCTPIKSRKKMIKGKRKKERKKEEIMKEKEKVEQYGGCILSMGSMHSEKNSFLVDLVYQSVVSNL